MDGAGDFCQGSSRDFQGRFDGWFADELGFGLVMVGFGLVMVRFTTIIVITIILFIFSVLKLVGFFWQKLFYEQTFCEGVVELDFLAMSSLFSSLIACYFFLGGAVAEAVAGGLVKKGCGC